jgi:hypothetical protein
VLDLTTFWWTLPALALLPVALLRRDVIAALLLALPAGVWLWSYGGAFLPSSSPDVTPDVRVVSYNTYVGAPDAAHVLALVEETSPDVLLLQEVFAPREEALLAGPRGLPPLPPGRSVAGGRGRDGAQPAPDRRGDPVLDASSRSRGTSVVRLDVEGRRCRSPRST